MSGNNLSQEQAGDLAAKWVLSRTLADVIYSARANLPSEHTAKKMESFCAALDRYIDWRVSGVIQEILKGTRNSP
jgi:hypothetical protein